MGVLKWKGEWDNRHRLHGRDGILQGKVRLWNAMIARNAERLESTVTVAEKYKA